MIRACSGALDPGHEAGRHHRWETGGIVDKPRLKIIQSQSDALAIYRKRKADLWQYFIGTRMPRGATWTARGGARRSRLSLAGSGKRAVSNS